MSSIRELYHSRFNYFLAGAFLLLFCLAWVNSFIQDDAFISFVYADNLANGKGLTWCDGEKVEGYTNFLWTVYMSIPEYFNIDPVPFSIWSGLVIFLVSLFFTYKTSSLLFKSRDLALLSVILLGTNYTFSAYATGGMETQLQACLFITAVYMLLSIFNVESKKSVKILGLSLVLGAAVLTRLDSAVLVLVVFPAAVVAVFRSKGSFLKKTGYLALLILPLLIITGSWFIWKLNYYGDIFPNTFYAKVSGLGIPLYGFYFLYLFIIAYLLFPFPILFLFLSGKYFKRENYGLHILTLLIILWCLYVISVGGDFMEFRFVVAIMPFIFVMLIWVIFNFSEKYSLRLALVILVLLGSLHNNFALTYSLDRKGIIEPVHGLYGHLYDPKVNWAGIGKVLGEKFEYNEDLKIAVTAAGAIPYYSRLQTIDMYGLNDKWIARNGVVIGKNIYGFERPGHMREATFDYLVERKVNLVLGQPYLKSYDEYNKKLYTYYDIQWFVHNFKLEEQESLPPDIKIIEIPIDEEYRLFVMYILPDPAIDKAIKENEWNVFPMMWI